MTKDEVKRLLRELERTEQTLRNLANGWLVGDAKTIANNEVDNLNRSIKRYGKILAEKEKTAAERKAAADKRKRVAARNRYRSTVCSGCRNNYYNFPKPKSARGDVAVPDDYSCWSILDIKRGKCPSRSR